MSSSQLACLSRKTPLINQSSYRREEFTKLEEIKLELLGKVGFESKFVRIR
jgi:hypothetical protein